MKQYKKRAARRIVRKSRKLGKVLTKMDVDWTEAVPTLCAALVEAIWHEGGDRDDAKATADIVHYMVCAGLDVWYDAEDKNKLPNVVQFRRKKKYFRS